MILLRQNPLNQELCLLEPIFQMDHHLDPLLQLLADLKHGYNVYQRDKLKSIPERMGDSLESEPLEPLVLEGLPDELGPEWRVLHPFEFLAVQFPTDDTAPNHRRLTENDALVELIQMAEYL